MTPAIKGMMLTVSSSLAASIVIKVTVTTALGLIAAWLGRGNRAAVRHTLLAAIFGVILLLPIAAVIMPPLLVGVPVEAESRTALPFLVTALDADLSATTAEAGPLVRPVTPQATKLSLSNLLLAGWAAGAALVLLPMGIGLWKICSLRRSGLPWRHGQSILETLAVDAGIHRHVKVLLHDALPGPMTCGVVHPAVVLPRDAEKWENEDLSRAIVHELEHVRRGDSVTRCLARVACAVYWFHPLVWIAWRKLALEAERSCDDAVLGQSEATAYADQLVGLAKRLSIAKRSPLLAMANRDDLATRVGAVLDDRQQRGRAGKFAVALACAAAVVLVVVMSPFILVAAPQATTAATPKFEVASIRPCGNGGSGRSDQKMGPPGGSPTISPGRLNTGCAALAGAYPMAGLIQRAYGRLGLGRPPSLGSALPISGGPAWIYSDYYVINAEGAKASEETMVGAMLQALLEDRFRLKVHRETRQVPVYTLTIAKGGPKLQQVAEGSCTPPDYSTYPMPPLPAGRKYCNNTGAGARKGPNTVLNQDEATVDFFCQLLTLILDRPVVDRTGLTGKYRFHIEFAIDQTTPRLVPEFGPPSDSPPAPSIFTVVQEQLGLRLDPVKGPRDFLVIDHVERPTEN